MSILYQSTNNNNKLTCPTDYSVCIACLEKTKKDSIAWNFRKPSDVTGVFAKLQYCFRMVYFTHCHTVANNNKVYKPFPSLQIKNNTPSGKSPTSKKSFLLSEITDEQGTNGGSEVIYQQDDQMPEDEEADIELIDKEEGNEDLVQ